MTDALDALFSSPAVWVFVILVNAFVLLYAVSLQVFNTYLLYVGSHKLRRYAKRQILRDYTYVASSPLSIPISIIAPAYNEAPTIEASLRSLLANHYEAVEIVVVNDGSSDETLNVLINAFRLHPVKRTPRSAIATQTIRGVYLSEDDPRIIVVDKENGGKADALNAGINFARYPLICSIDADTIVDPASLEKLVWEFQMHPETVATGGTVRIANGSLFRNGQLTHVRASSKLIANLQIVEYLRAFLGGRIGWSERQMLLIISGAFGLFRRDALVAVGGYDTTTVGEDAELVLRLYRHYLDTGQPFRATFFPDPVCWTEAPSRFRDLARQRDRWQRGLTEMLWKHRDMLWNRKYGRLGRLALPYFWAFELFGPVIEVAGYVSIPIAAYLGIISVPVAVLAFIMATLYGVLLSFVVLIMQGNIPGRYSRWSDLARLGFAAIIENFGYRQWLSFVRVRAMLRVRSKNRSWGEMRRAGFAESTHPSDVKEQQLAA